VIICFISLFPSFCLPDIKASLTLGCMIYDSFQDISGFMHPAALLIGFWPEFGYRFPEPQRTITASQFRCNFEATLLQIR
jgi:hypothetical protein